MKNIFKSIILLTLFSFHTVAAAEPPSPTDKDAKKTTEVFKPCQTRSPNSGSFFDLNPIRILPPPPPEESEPDAKAARHGHLNHHKSQKAQGRRRGLSALEEKDEPPSSWHVRGYDYPANFTMNFCGPVVEDIKDVVNVDKSKWQNVSAYYTIDDRVFSIGSENAALIWRGRKLTLNYTGGSPCPKAGDEKKDQSEEGNWSKRRKSTLISLLCERDPLAPKAALAFVGTNDHCTYFFEARSYAACPAVQTETQQVGPSGVFGLIFGIAFLVYLVGGVVYQRAVMHQRGWRQLPNYALWHGIFSFVQDMLIILFSSCLRCFGNQRKTGRGYGQLGNSGGINGYANEGASSARMRRANDLDENRLIDDLDEEWHD